MGKKSRPTSDKPQAPAAAAPLKANPPASKASEPAAPPVEAIEAQVDALLGQAQEQVQSMSELINEPAPNAPPHATAEAKPNGAETASEEPPASTAAPETPATDDEGLSASDEPANAETCEPLDTEALQMQVDAILAEAVQCAEPAAHAMEEHDSNLDPLPPADPPDGEAPVSEVARPERPSEAEIASVDAVIADAAQRALDEDEDDDFEAMGVARDESDLPGVAPAAPAARTASTPEAVPAPAPSASPRRAAVVKGGDASMRREKRKEPRPPAADAGLDGNLRPPPSVALPEPPAAAGPKPKDFSWLRPPMARTALGLRAKIAHAALQALAAMNSPWKRWSPATRKAILALTFVNIVLAVGAYMVLLGRLI